MSLKKEKQTGIFSSKEAATNSKKWWERQGYTARIRKLVKGYVVDLYK